MVGTWVLAVPSLCHLAPACPDLGLGRLPSTLKQGELVVGHCHLPSQDQVAVPTFLPLLSGAASEGSGGLVRALAHAALGPQESLGKPPPPTWTH